MSARGEFSSRIGFVLAAAGSAVGLGNIWGFPTKVAENGGAAFVLMYLVMQNAPDLCVFSRKAPDFEPFEHKGSGLLLSGALGCHRH